MAIFKDDIKLTFEQTINKMRITSNPNPDQSSILICSAYNKGFRVFDQKGIIYSTQKNILFLGIKNKIYCYCWTLYDIKINS